MAYGFSCFPSIVFSFFLVGGVLESSCFLWCGVPFPSSESTWRRVLAPYAQARGGQKNNKLGSSPSDADASKSWSGRPSPRLRLQNRSPGLLMSASRFFDGRGTFWCRHVDVGSPVRSLASWWVDLAILTAPCMFVPGAVSGWQE
ncbi:hypothetical protein FB451DRAFT_515741 [Mycena latifolia]|nr:hypothetical protein FB451DRAFT_515741 [Mycena latifolia]